MVKLFTKYITLSVLAMFMTGIANVSTDSLVHDMLHDNDVKHTVAANHHLHHQHHLQHEHVAHAGNGTGNEANADEHDMDSNIDINEHQILHALNHLQFFPDMALTDVVLLPLTNTAPLQFAPQRVPLASIDPLLRPPQSGLLPA